MALNIRSEIELIKSSSYRILRDIAASSHYEDELEGLKYFRNTLTLLQKIPISLLVERDEDYKAQALAALVSINPNSEYSSILPESYRNSRTAEIVGTAIKSDPALLAAIQKLESLLTDKVQSKLPKGKSLVNAIAVGIQEIQSPSVGIAG